MNENPNNNLEMWKEQYTPLNNSIRTADELSTKLPVTDLNIAPLLGADSNLHWYISNTQSGIIVTNL